MAETRLEAMKERGLLDEKKTKPAPGPKEAPKPKK